MSKKTYSVRDKTVNYLLLALTTVVVFCSLVSQSSAYNFNWQMDETPEGSESATIIEPLKVTILDEQVEVADNSASIQLMQKYSVYLGAEWDAGKAYRLLSTFETIPQEVNDPFQDSPALPASLWRLTDSHVQDDIKFEFVNRQTVVTIASEAFT